jgi:hypothetical protein
MIMVSANEWNRDWIPPGRSREEPPAPRRLRAAACTGGGDPASTWGGPYLKPRPSFISCGASLRAERSGAPRRAERAADAAFSR